MPPQGKEGLIVNLFKKRDKEDPWNYRGITLLSVVGKVFCKVLNNSCLLSIWRRAKHCMRVRLVLRLKGVVFIIFKNVLDNGRKKVNQLHSVISNMDINLSARRLLLLAVVRSTLEYGKPIRLRQLC